MNRPEFYPVRSLIYVDLAHEDYRIKLENWLYRYHIPDSISQFAPYMPAAIRAIGPTCTPIYGLIKAHVGGRIPTKRARVSTSLYLPLPPSRLRLSLLLILFPFLPHCNITMITSHII